MWKSERGQTSNCVRIPECASSQVNGWAQMDLVGEAMTLHARCSVDCVSKQTVARHLLPDYTCQDRTTVETHSDLQTHNESYNRRCVLTGEKKTCLMQKRLNTQESEAMEEVLKYGTVAIQLMHFM